MKDKTSEMKKRNTPARKIGTILTILYVHSTAMNITLAMTNPVNKKKQKVCGEKIQGAIEGIQKLDARKKSSVILATVIAITIMTETMTIASAPLPIPTKTQLTL